MAPALQTASIITFCIAAVLILVCLRMFFLKRAPLKRAFQELRAKHDTQYRERRLQQQHADLEAQAAAAASETGIQQTTRLWYGHRVTEVVVGEGSSRRYYYYNHTESENESGVRGRHGNKKLVLTKREVEFYFPEVEFKDQEQQARYMSFETTKTGENCKDNDTSSQAGVDEKEKALDTVMTVSTEVTVVASSKADDEKPSDIADKKLIEENNSRKMVATDNTCIICLQAMENADLTRSMRCCRNVFHSACVLEWLSSYKAGCPLCRFDYSALHDNSEL